MISLIWREIVIIKEMIKKQNKNIKIIYKNSIEEIYIEQIVEKNYLKNYAYVSVFHNCIQNNDNSNLSVPMENKQMLYMQGVNFLKLFKLCKEHYTPMISATVIKYGKNYYKDLEEFIYLNKINYKVYKATHNKADLILFNNL